MSRSWRSARIALGIKDKFQIASLKAISREPGCPKAKYLSVIMEFIVQDHNKFEEFVLNCHALSLWSEKVTVCCKVLVTLLVVVQTGPPLTSAGSDAACLYLTRIRDTWARADMFLSQFAVVLMQRITFLTEHPHFAQHFNLTTTSTNCLSLPHLDSETALSILSQLLSYQSRLMTLVSLGLKNQRNADYMRNKERETIKGALFTLYEDSYCTYVACVGILQFVSQQVKSGTYSGAASTVTVMRDLFDEQFVAVRAVYLALLDLESTNGAGSVGNSYSVIEHELSRFPEQNPLSGPLGQQYPLFNPTAQLSMGKGTSAMDISLI